MGTFDGVEFCVEFGMDYASLREYPDGMETTMNATTQSHASNAALRLAEANKSVPFAAYPGWQLDVRATLDSHAQLVAALKPFSALIEWADIDETDKDDDAFITGTRNDVQRLCGAAVPVITVGDIRRARAALTAAQE